MLHAPARLYTTPRPRITDTPGIALATDRQEDRLQAVPVGPQGVERAGADVDRRHIDICLQCPVGIAEFAGLEFAGVENDGRRRRG